MISFELLRDEGILVVEPKGTLEVADFAALTREVDPYIEEKGELRGLMIQAESFPGWGDFGALVSHLSFIRTSVALRPSRTVPFFRSHRGSHPIS